MHGDKKHFTCSYFGLNRIVICLDSVYRSLNINTRRTINVSRAQVQIDWIHGTPQGRSCWVLNPDWINLVWMGSRPHKLHQSCCATIPLLLFHLEKQEDQMMSSNADVEFLSNWLKEIWKKFNMGIWWHYYQLKFIPLKWCDPHNPSQSDNFHFQGCTWMLVWWK